jgi:DNA-binding NtrC family response regulator
MKDNTFRRPLYERFGQTLSVPPLRDRTHEIPLLAYYFLDKASAEVRAISRDALKCLRTYDWPGNVRELKHVIKTAATAKKGFIFSWDLADKVRLAKRVQQVVQRRDKTLRGMERDRIMEVLEETRGNVGEAIRILGISRATLYNKVKEHDLQIPGRKVK